MVGTMTIVNTVATINPNINPIAIGTKNELPDIASGISPTNVVVVLKIIGLNLLSTESLHASCTEKPSCLA